jgi:hypothetical protein
MEGKITKCGPGSMMYSAANKLHGIVNTGKTPHLFYFYKWQSSHHRVRHPAVGELAVLAGSIVAPSARDSARRRPCVNCPGTAAPSGRPGRAIAIDSDHGSFQMSAHCSPSSPSKALP